MLSLRRLLSVVVAQRVPLGVQLFIHADGSISVATSAHQVQSARQRSGKPALYEGTSASERPREGCMVLVDTFESSASAGGSVNLEVTAFLESKINNKIHLLKVDKRKLARAVIRVLFNQVLGLPLMILMHHAMRWRGCSFGTELPTFQWVVWELFVFTWMEEIGFYYSHRYYQFTSQTAHCSHACTSTAGFCIIHSSTSTFTSFITSGRHPLVDGRQ